MEFRQTLTILQNNPFTILQKILYPLYVKVYRAQDERRNATHPTTHTGSP